MELGSMRLQQAIVSAGAFISGAEGLRFESNDCSSCEKGECHQDPHGPTVLQALATGPPPDANQI